MDSGTEKGFASSKVNALKRENVTLRKNWYNLYTNIVFTISTYGHTKLKRPVPVRSLQSKSLGDDQ